MARNVEDCAVLAEVALDLDLPGQRIVVAHVFSSRPLSLPGPAPSPEQLVDELGSPHDRDRDVREMDMRLWLDTAEAEIRHLS